MTNSKVNSMTVSVVAVTIHLGAWFKTSMAVFGLQANLIQIRLLLKLNFYSCFSKCVNGMWLYSD